MRTVGGSPSWEFSSLASTATLAITVGTEPIYTQRQITSSHLPLHLQQSALANPISGLIPPKEPKRETPQIAATTTAAINTGTIQNKRKKSGIIDKANKHCDYHPNSKNHDTNECNTNKRCEYHPNSKGHDTSECRSQMKGNPPAQLTAPPTSIPFKSTQPPLTSMTTTTVKVEPKRNAIQDHTNYPLGSQIQCFRCSQPGHIDRDCPRGTGKFPKVVNQPLFKPTANAGQTKSTATPPPKRIRRTKVSFNPEPTSPTVFETTLSIDPNTPTQE